MKNCAELEVDLATPLFCPACGKVIFGEGDDGTKCRHVIFTFVSELGEFFDVSAKYQEIIEKIEDGEDVFDFLEEARKQINKPSILFLSVSSSGMACGPVSSTASVAIDFDLSESSEDKDGK